MAKKFFKVPKHDSGTSITTKTFFGSDSSMVVPNDDDILKGIIYSLIKSFARMTKDIM
jgi:hypothetical protein